MLQPFNSMTGKLLFKWDRERRMIQIQKKNEIRCFVVTEEGALEEVASPNEGPDNAPVEPKEK